MAKLRVTIEISDHLLDIKEEDRHLVGIFTTHVMEGMLKMMRRLRREADLANKKPSEHLKAMWHAGPTDTPIVEEDGPVRAGLAASWASPHEDLSNLPGSPGYGLEEPK